MVGESRIRRSVRPFYRGTTSAVLIRYALLIMLFTGGLATSALARSDNGAGLRFGVLLGSGGAMFRADAAHTGAMPGPGPQGIPSVAWKAPTGGPVDASPVIADGTVFVTSRDGFLHAVDPMTGATTWRLALGGEGTISTPAVVDGVVYVGSEGGVFAVDAASGVPLWSVATSDAVGSSPVVVEGVVFVGDRMGVLLALDAETGQERWRIETDLSIASSPLVVDGVVYAAAVISFVEYIGGVFAVDAETGAELWSAWVPILSSPTYSDGVLYFGDLFGTFYALDAASGQELWQTTIAEDISASPAVVDGVVYVGTWEGIVFALDAGTGGELWRFDTGEPELMASAGVADGTVYVAGGAGTLFALAAKSGTEVWRVPIPGDGISSPLVAGGYVFVGGGDGLYAIGDETVGAPIASNPENTLESAEAAAFRGTTADGGEVLLVTAAESVRGFVAYLPCNTTRQPVAGGAMASAPIVDGEFRLSASADWPNGTDVLLDVSGRMTSTGRFEGTVTIAGSSCGVFQTDWTADLYAFIPHDAAIAMTDDGCTPTDLTIESESKVALLNETGQEAIFAMMELGTMVRISPGEVREVFIGGRASGDVEFRCIVSGAETTGTIRLGGPNVYSESRLGAVDDAAATVVLNGGGFSPSVIVVPSSVESSVVVVNTDSRFHTFTIAELGINVPLRPGSPVSVGVDAPPGAYVITCAATGQHGAGEIGILLVS